MKYRWMVSWEYPFHKFPLVKYYYTYIGAWLNAFILRHTKYVKNVEIDDLRNIS